MKMSQNDPVFINVPFAGDPQCSADVSRTYED
jgi:hypothetical protein